MLWEIDYGKYLRGKTRSFCIIRLNVSDITFEQTNSFLCTTNFSICRAELRCEEAAIPKAEVKSSVGGCARRTRVRNPFGRLQLSDLPPSKRRDNSQSSLGLCAATWVCNILIFILNNSFNRVYIHLLLHIRSITPRASACRSILVQARTDASFVRETVDGRVMRVPTYFATPAVTVNEGQEYDIDALQSNLLHKVDQWNKRGSNFNIERVSRFVLSIHLYRPLHGSAFVRTPDFLANKHCIINVQNNDEKCFVWSVLSALYPATHDPQRLSKYKNYEHSLNVEGLTFPVQTKQIPLFENSTPPYP